MRWSSTCIPVVLALLQSTNALNAAVQRKINILADMGYNPDGTPMDLDVENIPLDTSVLSSLRLKQSLSTSTALVSAAAEKIVPEYVTLPLDNFHASKGHDASYEGTFNNRYWVAESGYKPGGPVFVYDVGEADAQPNALFRIQNETSFFKQIVDEFGGIGVVWEHRFCEFILALTGFFKPQKR